MGNSVHFPPGSGSLHPPVSVIGNVDVARSINRYAGRVTQSGGWHRGLRAWREADGWPLAQSVNEGRREYGVRIVRELHCTVAHSGPERSKRNTNDAGYSAAASVHARRAALSEIQIGCA